jgi:1,4-alpha-glucan branching enzyme
MTNLRQGIFLPDEWLRIVTASHHDPFEVLGPHSLHAKATTSFDTEVRLFLPRARSASLRLKQHSAPLDRIDGTDFFIWRGLEKDLPIHYQMEWHDRDNQTHCSIDPYTFAPQLGDLDLHLFGEGRNWSIHDKLGAHLYQVDGIEGVLFAVWAPGAERISVVGDFNGWDGRCHPMRVRSGSGVWELFVPGLAAGAMYKYEIRNRATGQIAVKTDPYGRSFEHRPKTAAIIATAEKYAWQDQRWMEERAHWDWQRAPVSVYEVHLGSWRRGWANEFLNYRELAHQLVDYVKPLGFTHVEIMPITEHPLDDSWGYQTTGYFAPTSRFGTPQDFRYFVDHLHQNGLGIILDWVPAHFPKDEHALACFDGSALYEHADPRLGEHRDWGTLIYNFGRNEVRNFLLASALFWLKEFHIDGLRVDAVASMLYLNYSREDGDWIPNIHGGCENLEAMHFLRELNVLCHGQHPGAMVIAEESTAWPQVTRPTWIGGLGFSMKWNMGWMHDTLNYMSKDPVHRKYHHDHLTFGMVYAFTENFQLPFSHDEVVHGKGSMIKKMPGDHWQKFANLRLLYTYMFTYPGSKLLFMGCEFGQWNEWAHQNSLDWHLLEFAPHQGLQTAVRDLNHLYQQELSLHQNNFQHEGFEWVDCHDSNQSVISYLRKSEQDFCLVILNFTPTPRMNYRIGVPDVGRYREIFNSDSDYYSGSNLGNGEGIFAEDIPWMGHAQSIELTLPPLAGLVLKLCD